MISKEARAVQAYYRTLQAQGQVNLKQKAVENFDWARMFTTLEEEFSRGKTRVEIGFSSMEQQKIVTAQLRKMGFKVDDDYYCSTFVSLKPSVRDWFKREFNYANLLLLATPMTLSGFFLILVNPVAGGILFASGLIIAFYALSKL